MKNIGYYICFFFMVWSVTLNAQLLKEELADKKLKMLIISDLNDSYGSVTYSQEVHDIINKITAIKPDIILCGGDMVAGQKASLTEQNLQDMWYSFDRDVLSPIHELGIPFGFTMGNHDASPNYYNDRKVASAFWEKNQAKVNLTFVDSTHFPYYFSYVKNNIFFMSWDASSAQIPDEVKSWMKEQLATSIAKKARGRILLGHLPLYAIVQSKNKKGEVLNDADETLAFLKENHIDMYISGHQHAYYPASKESVTLMNCGCIGGGPRKILGQDDEPYKAYTIIEIPKRKGVKKAKIIGIKASTHEHIDIKSLPSTVTGFNGTVQRLDL